MNGSEASQRVGARRRLSSVSGPRRFVSVASALWAITSAACHTSPATSTSPADLAPAPTVDAAPVLVRAPPAAVPRYGRLELTWRVASRPDPARAYSPLEADFVAPSGRVWRVAGFDSAGLRRVRFAPAELGAYRFEVRDPAAAGAVLLRGGFESTPSAERGMVRIDPGQPHRLKLDSGEPFFVLGENRINIYDPSWNYGQKGIAEYVRYMAENAMTTLRVFIFADARTQDGSGVEARGCLEPELGRYDESVARRFDEIFEAAEANGIYVVLTVFSIGFTPNDSWKGWDGNPYNVRNGGFAREPSEVFTRADLRNVERRKLEYVLARWGYSSHLLAIDLLNEPEWDGPVPESTWIPWAHEMASAVHRADPYGHLVTIGSVGLQSNVDIDERPLYASGSDDLIEWHLYGEKTYDPHAHALEMARKVRETYGYGKPVFCGEFGYGGEDPAFYDHTHTGIWAATFAGGGALAHSAPPFNIDSDEPMTPERGRHFRVLGAFLRSLDWARRLEPDPTITADGAGDARVFALGSPEYKAFWLLAPAAGYGAPVVGARLSVPGLPAGRYEVTFVDDVSGDVVGRVDGQVGRDPLVVGVPTFARHVAGVIAPPGAYGSRLGR
ncbi:MAG TPA: cellulase family glycosylhydrolase [Polyangiaceae bacterium]|nr:cellulase family glycosylhydrolase [Polyangiaceae bacterium]